MDVSKMTLQNGTNEGSVPNNTKIGETLASAVYDRLLQDILNGKLEPGLKLRLQVLKKQYDVGNSPLREALNRLSEKGMVVREENKGFRVAPASEQELKELTRTRSVHEPEQPINKAADSVKGQQAKQPAGQIKPCAH